MNWLARILIPAALTVSAFLVAGLPAASHVDLGYPIAKAQIANPGNSPPQKKEFWDKFRRAVEPEGKNPNRNPPNNRKN